MSGLPAAVRPCIDEALARSAQLLARAMDLAAATLEEEARSRSGAGRQELATAARELGDRRLAWSTGFAPALRRAIDSGGNAAGAGVRINPSTLTLTLVDDSQVVQSIEASRLAQQLESRLEQTLAELDAYMSSAMQFDGIQPELNPLRPSVFAQAVRAVMNDPEPAPGRPAVWMQHMTQPLAEDIAQLYASCVKLLVRANVRAAGYRISGPAPLETRNSRPAGLRPSTGPASPRQEPDVRHGAAAQAEGSGWMDIAGQLLGPRLRDFLFGPAAAAQQPLAPAFYRRVDQELAALEARPDEPPPDSRFIHEHAALPPVERPIRPVGTSSPLKHEHWGAYGAPRQRSLVRTRLRKQAQRAGQVMGIELVRQLVDQVAQDPRLLAPVREAMVALEPSLARLAMHSPRFLAEQDNPARALLESVAQRSFRYNDEFDPEFLSFFEGVRGRFKALNELEAFEDARPFEQARDSLAGEWERQDAVQREARDQVIEAVAAAERRQAEADRIAAELSRRSDLDGVPAVVQEFLFGPWSLVIAQARLSSAAGTVDPGGYIGVISDLLWSVKGECTLREPARAFEVLPQVLVKLREGLEMLGHPPGELQAFFKALERLHRPVLKLRAQHRRQALPADVAQALLDEDLRPVPAQKPRPTGELWLARAELRDCGFEDTLPIGHADLHEASLPTAQGPSGSGSGVAGATGPAEADSIIGGLREGCWVDLYSHQRWLRAQLTWASTRGTLFMFVSQGGQPHSMTRRSLQRLVAARLLRPVDAGEVVQHAIDVLASAPAAPQPHVP